MWGDLCLMIGGICRLCTQRACQQLERAERWFEKKIQWSAEREKTKGCELWVVCCADATDWVCRSYSCKCVSASFFLEDVKRQTVCSLHTSLSLAGVPPWSLGGPGCGCDWVRERHSFPHQQSLIDKDTQFVCRHVYPAAAAHVLISVH